MGILERKERERAERRTLIMGCAKKLILEYGPDKVSMMDIAEQAELSKATLYLYFPSKDVLFRDICEEAGNQFTAYLQSRMPPEGLPALESLKLYWQCYLDMFGASEEMLVLFSMKRYLAPAAPFIPIDEGASPPGDSSYMYYEMIRRLIGQGIAEGLFEPDTDPDMVARMIVSLFSYTMENAAKMPLGQRNSIPLIGEMGSFLQIMLRGIVREGLDRSSVVLPLAGAGGRTKGKAGDA